MGFIAMAPYLARAEYSLATRTVSAMLASFASILRLVVGECFLLILEDLDRIRSGLDVRNAGGLRRVRVQAMGWPPRPAARKGRGI